MYLNSHPAALFYESDIPGKRPSGRYTVMVTSTVLEVGSEPVFRLPGAGMQHVITREMLIEVKKVWHPDPNGVRLTYHVPPYPVMEHTLFFRDPDAFLRVVREHFLK